VSIFCRSDPRDLAFGRAHTLALVIDLPVGRTARGHGSATGNAACCVDVYIYGECGREESEIQETQILFYICKSDDDNHDNNDEEMHQGRCVPAATV